MLKVFVASPFRGRWNYIQEKNKQYARKCCRAVVDLGHVAYAPHLLDTQYLNDKVDHERAIGIRNGQEMMKACDMVIAFIDLGTSDGMKSDIAFAKKNNIPVFTIHLEQLPDFMRNPR